MKRYLLTLLLAILAACGGGDPEPDQPHHVCDPRPELCQ